MSRGRRRGVGGFLVSLLATLSLGACSDEDVVPGPTEVCPDKVGDVCVGVTRPVLCETDGCTDGAVCAAIAQATDDASLASALSSAAPGACVTVAPGAYAAVAIPEGVSVLGRGADLVTLAGVVSNTGSAASGAVLQGVSVGAGGLLVEGTGGLAVRQVRVTGAAGDGVEIAALASASLSNVEILDAAGVGLRAVDAGDVDVTATWVRSSEGPGILYACSGGCACTTQGSLDAVSVLVREAAHVGAYFAGRPVSLEEVVIDGTRVMGLEANSGGGLSASQCAAVKSSRLTVSGSDYFGILIDGASAALSSSPSAGGSAEEKGIIIHDNVFGVWINGTDPAGGGVTLEGMTISSAQGVGLGVGPAAEGIIIHDMEIRDTGLKVLPVGGGGAEAVGDGLLWGNGAAIAIDGLKIQGSARQSVLVDAAFGAGSSLADVTLAGGDELTGIVQQSYAGAGVDPDVGPGVPTIETVPDAVFALPVPPGAPASP